jgi:hypothetical protein
MLVGNNESAKKIKCRRIAGNFKDAAVRRGAHRPIEHNQGFNLSHWMLMVDEFE